MNRFINHPANRKAIHTRLDVFTQPGSKCDRPYQRVARIDYYLTFRRSQFLNLMTDFEVNSSSKTMRRNFQDCSRRPHDACAALAADNDVLRAPYIVHS